MVSTASLSVARFSTTTWTSDPLPGRTWMAPSNVLSVTSGLPATVNCFSSRSRYWGKSLPDISTHADALTSAAATVSSPSLPSILPCDAIAILHPPGVGPLDGRRDRGVSGIHEVAADVGLHDREVRVKD